MEPDDDPDELPTGAMIKAARALLDMDQAALAEAVGVTVKTISRIENGVSGRNDERRTTVVRQIRDHLVEKRHVIFLHRQGEHGAGVRLRHP